MFLGFGDGFGDGFSIRGWFWGWFFDPGMVFWPQQPANERTSERASERAPQVCDRFCCKKCEALHFEGSPMLEHGRFCEQVVADVLLGLIGDHKGTPY